MSALNHGPELAKTRRGPRRFDSGEAKRDRDGQSGPAAVADEGAARRAADVRHEPPALNIR
jgi:hypothetical protein